MLDIKVDLQNKLKSDKYYEERELIRLAKDNQLNHKVKIDLIDNIFRNIALINQKSILIDQYFVEEKKQNNEINNQPNNQTHSE